MNLTRKTFEKSELFKLLDEWVDQRIASEYGVSGHYVGKTEQWIEDEFDEKGFKKAKQSCYDAAWTLFISFEETQTFSNKDIERYFCVPNSHRAAILGIIFALLSEDYPNIKPIMGNRYIVFRKYEECISKFFLEFDYIDEWLKLYAMIHPFVLRNKLPQLFQGEKAKAVLDAFRYAGYLDSEYKPVRSVVKSNMVAAILCDVINSHITGADGNVRWKDVGDYWGISKFKQYFYRAGGWKGLDKTRDMFLEVYH